MSNDPNYYEFYFKEVYTVNFKYYRFNPEISINTFIEEVKLQARIDFHLRNDEDIEVVEAGQSDNVVGRISERAPAIEPSDSKLREKYGTRVKNTAFYIRKVSTTADANSWVGLA
jgi:hypothetical protein